MTASDSIDSTRQDEKRDRLAKVTSDLHPIVHAKSRLVRNEQVLGSFRALRRSCSSTSAGSSTRSAHQNCDRTMVVRWRGHLKLHMLDLRDTSAFGRCRSSIGWRRQVMMAKTQVRRDKQSALQHQAVTSRRAVVSRAPLPEPVSIFPNSMVW